MSTNSTIAITNHDGTVTGIYCHWDGGYWHVGPTLYNHYQTEAEVRELLALGDISSLGEDTDSTEAYGRDRGEKDTDPTTVLYYKNFLEQYGQEYNYLFIPNDGWFVETKDGIRSLKLELDEHVE